MRTKGKVKQNLLKRKMTEEITSNRCLFVACLVFLIQSSSVPIFFSFISDPMLQGA